MSFHLEFRHGQALIGWNTAEFSSSNGVKLGILLIIALMLGSVSSSVFAQEDKAAAIKIGESNFIPTVRFEYLQTDNAFLTSKDPLVEDAQTEATAFVVRPRASWTADRRLLALTGIYEGAYATYSESALDYADHSLRGIVDAELSSRQRLRGRLAFDFGHQALGTGITAGFDASNASQVEFLNTDVRGSYIYGARQAQGNVEVGFQLVNRTYQNEDNLTDGYGYTSVRPYGQFSYRLSSDTRAITTVRFNSTTFDLSARDRNDILLLAGLSFDATGKTGGEFQLGAGYTDFSLATNTDESRFIAEADLFFEPTNFSRFEFTAARVLDNDAGSPLNSNSVLTITDSAKLNWEHQWSSRFYHVANLSYQLENGDCPDSRDITRASGGIELNLVLKRWLHVGAGVSGANREATRCASDNATDDDFDYESQYFGTHIRATL